VLGLSNPAFFFQIQVFFFDGNLLFKSSGFCVGSPGAVTFWLGPSPPFILVFSRLFVEVVYVFSRWTARSLCRWGFGTESCFFVSRLLPLFPYGFCRREFHSRGLPFYSFRARLARAVPFASSRDVFVFLQTIALFYIAGTRLGWWFFFSTDATMVSLHY